MHAGVTVVCVESKRGCGYRHPGLYWRSDGATQSCGRLPIPLCTCPTCGRGVRPARGATWVDADEIVRAALAKPCATPDLCWSCPVGRALDTKLGRSLLIWIGEAFYPTPADFNAEARKMGVSRRIPSGQVPKGFEPGKTWILLAHRKAIPAPLELGQEPTWTPGIFGVWRPDRIEIVLKGDETDAEVDRYIARGLVPVIVKRAPEDEKPVQSSLLDLPLAE